MKNLFWGRMVSYLSLTDPYKRALQKSPTKEPYHNQKSPTNHTSPKYILGPYGVILIYWGENIYVWYHMCILYVISIYITFTLETVISIYITFTYAYVCVISCVHIVCHDISYGCNMYIFWWRMMSYWYIEVSISMRGIMCAYCMSWYSICLWMYVYRCVYYVYIVVTYDVILIYGGENICMCVSCVHIVCHECIWGGYGQQDRSNYRSLLQNIVSFIGLFCKKDLTFYRSY